MIFETDRLLVRQLDLSDFEPFHEMQSDDEVMKFTSGLGLHEAANRKQLTSCIEAYRREKNDFWVWAVLQKSVGHFVGTCAVVRNDQRQHEIGYRLLRKFWNLGYGQEICDALIAHALEKMNLDPIVAYVDQRNIASVKILDRSNMEFVMELNGKDGAIDRYYRKSRKPGE